MAHYRSNLHDWAIEPRKAVALQRSLQSRLQLTPLKSLPETIAGADISFNRYSSTVYAGIIVLSLPALEVVEQVGTVTQVHFPYVPGLLSFREIPPLLEAWKLLNVEPDVVMIDGHGIAHPRRFGIASHFGLVVERPTIGCGKSVLIGTFDMPEPHRGSWTAMRHHDEVIGAAVRTKNNVQPMYVSPGNLIDLNGSITLTLSCCTSYRLPEPTRRAHLLVNALRRGEIPPT
jgi:deoxyribonuclease V